MVALVTQGTSRVLKITFSDEVSGSYFCIVFMLLGMSLFKEHIICARRICSSKSTDVCLTLFSPWFCVVALTLIRAVLRSETIFSFGCTLCIKQTSFAHI